MDIFFLIKGIVIGFLVSAPVGPIGILCINRTLSNGRASGLVTGLGAATVDGIYGAIAAFGLTFVSTIVIGQQFCLRLVGGVFLLYLGIRIFTSKPLSKVHQRNNKDLIEDYVSTFLLALTNPVTIFIFAAIFAAFGLGTSSSRVFSAVMIVMGVTLGSSLWWFILSRWTSIYRDRVHTASLQLINWISGSIIFTFAVVVFLSFLKFR